MVGGQVIRNLTRDDEVWEVQWLGQLLKNPSIPSEYLIDVLMQRASPGGLQAGSVAEYSNDTFVAQVGIGDLPSIQIGSRWQRGRRVGLADLEQLDGEIDFSPNRQLIISAGHRLPDEPNPRNGASPVRYLIPPKVKKFPRGMLNSHYLSLPYEGISDRILIPCVEVARAWYLRSSQLALTLTSGPFGVVKDQLYNDKKSSATENSWTVTVGTGFDESDSKIIAALAFLPHVRRAAALIAGSIIKANSRGTPCFIEARAPLDGRHRLRARGSWFKSGGYLRFLVSYLSAVDTPPMPRDFWWNTDQDNRSDDGERDDLIKSWNGPKWVPYGTAKVVRIGTRSEPDSRIPATRLAGLLPELLNAPTPQRLARTPQTHEHGQNVIISVHPTEEHSTGAGEPFEGGATRAKIIDPHSDSQSEKRRAPISPSFDSLLEAIGIVNKTSGIVCKAIAASPETEGESGQLISILPSPGPSGSTGWCFVGNRPRQILVIEMTRENDYAYVFEVERAGLNGAGPGKIETYTTAVLVSTTKAPLTSEELAEALSECVEKKGVWQENILGYSIVKLKHTHIDTEAFANKLQGAFHYLVRKQEQSVVLVTPPQATANEPAWEPEDLRQNHM
jgi:hypothetical protein